MDIEDDAGETLRQDDERMQTAEVILQSENDPVQTENLQPHWASNWIVLQNIFKNLDNSELSVVAKVCRQWNNEVQKIRTRFGLNETIKITGRKSVTSCARLLEVLASISAVRSLQLTNLRFPVWPVWQLDLDEIFTSELSQLHRLSISKCSTPVGFTNVLDCISELAPNLKEVKVESNGICPDATRALLRLTKAKELTRFSASEFVDEDSILLVMQHLSQSNRNDSSSYNNSTNNRNNNTFEHLGLLCDVPLNQTIRDRLVSIVSDRWH